ncbi:hypothetical protein F4804DRAFT_332012 [Jackrogersella minutella]|nr:hypothetical protein F4804DRAFT_332012 [Jackrogersella minutella]
MSSPLHDLRNEIDSDLRNIFGIINGLEVSITREEAGCIPYNMFWVDVDPKEVIPRNSKEWEEVQWKMSVPVINVSFSNVDEWQNINSYQAAQVVDNAINKYIRVFDEGNESYSPMMGIDPRLFLAIIMPFEMIIRPQNVLASLPPTCSAEYKSQSGFTDEQLKSVKHTLYINDPNDSFRVIWEREWTRWAVRAARPSILGRVSRLMNNGKKRKLGDK